jgi:hypothetical protein
MPLRGYVARLAREFWETRLVGEQLLSGQPTHGQAQDVAEDFGHESDNDLTRDKLYEASSSLVCFSTSARRFHQ